MKMSLVLFTKRSCLKEMSESLKIKNIRKKIAKMDQILILMHGSPDIDAIGSAYALLLFFLKKGKKAFIGIEEPIPSRYSFFLDKDKQNQFFITKKEADSRLWEWVIALDTSDVRLLGEFKDMTGKNPVLVLDHHATFHPYGAFHFNDPSYSSTSEILFDILEKELDYEKALSLYAGIVYDTGHFRYSSTTPALLRKIAFLIEKYQINTEWVYYHIFENESIERKKLSCLISSTIESYEKNEVIVSYFPLRFKQELNLNESDTSDLVFVGNSVAGCLFSIFVKEKKDGVSVSLRSRTDFDVAELAEQWGGGGHQKASGIKIKNTTLEKSRTELVPALIQHYKKWRENQP